MHNNEVNYIINIIYANINLLEQKCAIRLTDEYSHLLY